MTAAASQYKVSYRMQYRDCLKKLYTTMAHQKVEGTSNPCLQLRQQLGCPDRHFHSIHIAGTNGKGSVTTKVAKGLEASGFRVGLFTSPHISTFRERIQINGKLISEEEVVYYLTSLLQLATRLHLSPTFFEMTTLIALLYFADQKVDYASIEVGLGGRLDATNFLEPLLCAITSISLDHTEVLGKTRRAIFYEKAAIIKPHTPVILGPNVPKLGKKEWIRVPDPKGSTELENRAISRHILEELRLSPDAIEKGLLITPPCRFEVHYPVVLDVGHNPDGLKRLFERLQAEFPNHTIHTLCALSLHKDHPQCLKLIQKGSQRIHLTRGSGDRSADPSFLGSLLLDLGVPKDRIHLHTNSREAFKNARAQLAGGEILCVCGSFYLMSEVRAEMGIQEPRDPL